MLDDWPDLTTLENFEEDLYPRLLIWIVRRMRRAGWNSDKGVPLAFTEHDYAHLAIQKALSRERRYDPSRNLLENLCQIASSEISNVQNSQDKKKVLRDGNVIDLVDFRENPEALAMRNSQLTHLLRYLDEKDKESCSVAEQIICFGHRRSIEISTELKIPVSKIENIKKRLRRLLQNYVQEHGAEPLQTRLAGLSREEGI